MLHRWSFVPYDGAFASEMTTPPAPPTGFGRIKAGSRIARQHALPLCIAAALIVPLVVASLALRAEEWAPIYDMALIEQRVRDVGTAHTPLVGLPGRLGTAQEPASHPGPLAFYLLAPGYHLFGGSGWALYASGALLNAVAIAVFVLVAWRKRSAPVLSAASAGLGLLMLGYGPTPLCEPWNAHFPMLWFAVFLIAGWAVACRDLAMLPLVAVTATLAAQTHIPYLPVCGALSAICAGITVVATLRAAKDSVERKLGLRVLLITIGILAVAWLPPLIEELREPRGNITRLVRYFRDPASLPIGLGQGLSAVLSRLDARVLAVDPWDAPGGFTEPFYPSEPGLLTGVMLAVWVSSAFAAIALGSRPLLTLHGVVLVSFGVAALAASRIIGMAYAHVMLWSWALAVLLVVACVATLGVLVARKLPASLRSRVASLGPALAFGMVALPALRLAFAATDGTRPASYAQGKLVSALARDTLAAIHRGQGVATRRAGRYLVSWSDPLNGSALGIALANELERAGLEIAHERSFTLAGAHRARDRAGGTARIHLAVGGWIAEGRHVPSAVLVSRVDLRTAVEQNEAFVLQTMLANALRKAGNEDLVKRIPYDLPGALAASPKLHPMFGLVRARLAEIGWPAAVFIMPPEVVLVRRLTLEQGTRSQ
jgi:hypothetical protein